MKTARELVWKIMDSLALDTHEKRCDALTAAIEARDQQFTDALNTELASIRADLDEVKAIAQRERDLARSQLETAVGALERVRDNGVADYGGKRGLRKCEHCYCVQEGFEAFVHSSKLSPEMEAWKPRLVPACIQAVRALATIQQPQGSRSSEGGAT